MFWRQFKGSFHVIWERHQNNLVGAVAKQLANDVCKTFLVKTTDKHFEVAKGFSYTYWQIKFVFRIVYDLIGINT